MNIKTLVVGKLATNCYILSKGNESLIIDPGDEAEKIISNINNKVVGIIVTHFHDDHIGALKQLERYYNTQVYSIFNMNEGLFKVGNFIFNVIKTLGHKEDSISIYFNEEKWMFVGDFIFKSSIGRMDLEGGSKEEMKKSISKILKYDDDILLYPGHGDTTTIGNERNNLQYIMSII